jgi:hypothetical protein
MTASEQVSQATSLLYDSAMSLKCYRQVDGPYGLKCVLAEHLERQLLEAHVHVEKIRALVSALEKANDS